MASLPKTLQRAALLGVATSAALTSCTLPPREAWRKIQDDGLISYITYEIKTPSHNAGAPTATAELAAASGSTSAQPTASSTAPAPTPLRRVPTMQEQERMLTAQSVPSLPGYVRSPYTNPPRLVDVRGASEGATMVCPYTQRKFIVPDMAAPSAVARTEAPEPKPTPRVVMNDKPVEKPTPAPVAPPTPAPSVAKKSATVTPTVTPEPPAPATTPAPAPAPAPSQVVATNPPPSPAGPPKTTTPPAPIPVPKPVQEIPFGTAISGRPGFVNSPFAAKHQLVDVTGLPGGMEVKCPYTGKLFRVPMQDMASSKPAETVPPLASPSPDKPEKK